MVSLFAEKKPDDSESSVSRSIRLDFVRLLSGKKERRSEWDRRDTATGHPGTCNPQVRSVLGVVVSISIPQTCVLALNRAEATRNKGHRNKTLDMKAPSQIAVFPKFIEIRVETVNSGPVVVVCQGRTIGVWERFAAEIRRIGVWGFKFIVVVNP